MSRRFLPLVLVSLLCVPPAMGQSAAPPSTISEYPSDCPSASSSTPDELIAAGDRLRGADQHEPSMQCFARAARLADEAGDKAARMRATLAFAQEAYSSSAYALAQTEVRNARARAVELDDRLNVARADRLLSSLAQMNGGDLEEGLRLSRSALAVFTELHSDRDRILVLLDISRLTASTGEKEEYLEEALKTARALGAPELEAMVRHARGDWNFGRGHFEDALTDLNEATRLFEAAGHFEDASDVYVSIGRLLRAHGRAADALAYYDKAAAIQERTNDLRGLAQSTNAKAVALGYLGRTQESIDAYKRALDIALRTGSTRIINFQKGNLAGAYSMTGDFARSNRLLEEVLESERDPYILAYRHNIIAQNDLALGDAAGAVPHSERAVEYARSSNNRDLLPVLLFNKAKAYRAVGRRAEAIAAAIEAVQIVEEIRSQLVPLDFMKRGFGDTWQSLFGITVALLNERGDAERSLIVSEQARARAFLDLLASRSVTAPAEIAPWALGTLEAGKLTSTASASTADATSIVSTATRLRSTIVAFWVSDDEAFAWVVRPGGPIRQKRLAVSRRTLESLVSSSMDRKGDTAKKAFGRLYTVLIEPLGTWLDGTDALTIVPHGPLARLSFAALRDARGSYLIERYAITYTPSISTLLLTAQRAGARHANRHYLLVADPRPLPSATPALAPLPGSRREVDAIATALGREGTVLTGREAGEAAVRRRAEGAGVIHFATHGVIRDDEPLDSYLAVGASGGDSATDGRLTVRELYGLRLSADLVALSACRTASGPQSGDGIAGLARAFFYAGTPTVVATLWPVADEPSARLMTLFYRHWHAGMSKRAALRQAQIDLIRLLRSGALKVAVRNGVVPLDEQPFYWAGYVLLGEP